MYNITGDVLIKAEMKGWISKRRDMSIKHTPSPKQQSVLELRLCGAASFADRKTSGKKTGQKWEKKGREKWWLQFHAGGLERRDQ